MKNQQLELLQCTSEELASRAGPVLRDIVRGAIDRGAETFDEVRIALFCAADGSVTDGFSISLSPYAAAQSEPPAEPAVDTIDRDRTNFVAQFDQVAAASMKQGVYVIVANHRLVFTLYICG